MGSDLIILLYYVFVADMISSSKGVAHSGTVVHPSSKN